MTGGAKVPILIHDIYIYIIFFKFWVADNRS